MRVWRRLAIASGALAAFAVAAIIDTNPPAAESPHPWGMPPKPTVTTVPTLSNVPKGLLDASSERALDRRAGTMLTLNPSVEVLWDSQARGGLLSLIRETKKSLLAAVLAIHCDAATEPVIAAIESRARTGLEVRLLVHPTYALLSRACHARLRAAGARVESARTHASYWVNDSGALLIGSQSLAWTFLESDGANGLDRDLMVLARGPVATDALADFSTLWEQATGETLSSIREQVLADRAREIADRIRGADATTGALVKGPASLCRFAARHPARQDAIGVVWIDLVARARRSLVMSGVQVGESEWIDAIRGRARQGLRANFLGNGWEGGNGELTLVLSRWARDLREARHPRAARAIERLRDRDRDAQGRRRLAGYRQLTPEIAVHAYPGFLHHKVWLFDEGEAFWVGSANPVDATLEHEAGIQCVASPAARELALGLALDRAASQTLSSW